MAAAPWKGENFHAAQSQSWSAAGKAGREPPRFWAAGAGKQKTTSCGAGNLMEEGVPMGVPTSTDTCDTGAGKLNCNQEKQPQLC